MINLIYFFLKILFFDASDPFGVKGLIEFFLILAPGVFDPGLNSDFLKSMNYWAKREVSPFFLFWILKSS